MSDGKPDNSGKQGKWITTETAHEWIEDFCSLCGFRTDAFTKLKKCPRCGAEMRTAWERGDDGEIH